MRGSMLGCGEDPLTGLQMADLSMCPWWREEGSGVSYSKDTS